MPNNVINSGEMLILHMKCMISAMAHIKMYKQLESFRDQALQYIWAQKLRLKKYYELTNGQILLDLPLDFRGFGFLCTALFPGSCSVPFSCQLLYTPHISQEIKAVKSRSRGEMKEMIKSTNSNPPSPTHPPTHPGRKMCTLFSSPNPTMVVNTFF